MAPSTSRKSYTAAYKLQIIEFAETNGNRAAERQFGVTESCVRAWRKAKDVLRITKRSKKALRGAKPRWTELEDRLEEWVLDQRAACRGISTVQIRLKAKTIAQEMDIPEFKGGPSWCFRFMNRKQLSIRTRTTMCQQVPADFQEKVNRFREFTSQKQREFQTDLDHIINMDEVPLTFDIPMTRSVEKKGASSVTIRTTGHEKSHFTVVLACCASGKKLPPMIIFKRKTRPNEKFPNGVIIENNVKGWMDTDMMKKWLSKCYVRRPDGFFKQAKAMLVMDSMRAHITDEVKDAIKALNTLPVIIPGGMTKLLQPLDISVNKAFKGHLRIMWETWMTSGDHSFTTTGRMRRATLAEVACWVKSAWGKVSGRIVTAGFQKAGILDFVLDEDNESENDDVDEVDEERESQTLPPEIAQLFESDSESEDFEGFESEPSDETDA